MSNQNKPKMPTMGTTGLWMRRNAVKSCGDAEIVTRIVLEKFKNFSHGRRNGGVRKKNLKSDDFNVDVSLSRVLSEGEAEKRIDDTNHDSVACLDETKDGFIGGASRSYQETHFDSMRDVKLTSDPKMPKPEDSSINSCQISSLLSKTTNVSDYNMFSRKTCCTSSPIYEKPCTVVPPQPPVDSRAEFLINEAAIQHQIILQTCKALNIIAVDKEFKASIEYVEAERILLLAMKKREAVLSELLASEEDEPSDEPSCLGEIHLENLRFAVAKRAEPSDADFSHWFFVMVRLGSTVLATEAVKADENQAELRFSKSFHFENLRAHFEIDAGIYTMAVRNARRLHGRSNKCPTPDKLVRLRKSPLKKPYYSYARRNPAFALYGATTIRIADISKPPLFKLRTVAHSSGAQAFLAADLRSDLQISASLAGFLTLGSEAGGLASWSRRWCLLDGHEFRYWNYPDEQAQRTRAVGAIDLRYCVGAEIGRAERELCARPRTLLLEVGRVSVADDADSLTVLRTPSCTITRHYLSADSCEEMARWRDVLNSVVFALRNWNSMKARFYF